jgi:hypothetical protein
MTTRRTASGTGGRSGVVVAGRERGDRAQLTVDRRQPARGPRAVSVALRAFGLARLRCAWRGRYGIVDSDSSLSHGAGDCVERTCVSSSDQAAVLRDLGRARPQDVRWSLGICDALPTGVRRSERPANPSGCGWVSHAPGGARMRGRRASHGRRAVRPPEGRGWRLLVRILAAGCDLRRANRQGLRGRKQEPTQCNELEG